MSGAIEYALRMRAAMEAKPLKLRKPPRARWPHRERMEYYKLLLAIIARVQGVVREQVLPQLGRIVAETNITRPEEQPIRVDAPGDTIEGLFEGVHADVEAAVPEPVMAAAATKMALGVSTHNGRELQRQVEHVAKINVWADTTGLVEHLELAVNDNVKLIKSLAKGHLDDIKGIVLRGARAGVHQSVIAEQIEQRFSMPKKRAALIANDQVGKLNGELNQIRQQRLGVRRYRWSSSQDERVRKRHRELNGTIQEWAKPPVADDRTGERAHPGQPIRCRCQPIPIVDDVLADLGLLDPSDVETGMPAPGGRVPPGLKKRKPANDPDVEATRAAKRAARERAAADAQAKAEAARKRAEAKARARAEADARRKAEAEAAAARKRAEAEGLARREAERARIEAEAAQAEAERQARIKARAEALAAARAEEAKRLKAEKAAKAKAAREAKKAEKEAAKRQAQMAKLKPGERLKEHTPEHWIEHYSDKQKNGVANYGDAARSMAYGRAMQERGEAMAMKDFRAAAKKLDDAGLLRGADYFARTQIDEEGTFRTVADAIRHYEAEAKKFKVGSDDYLAEKHRAASLRMISSLSQHIDELGKATAKVDLGKAQIVGRLSARQLEHVEYAMARQEKIYSTVTKNTVKFPIAAPEAQVVRKYEAWETKPDSYVFRAMERSEYLADKQHREWKYEQPRAYMDPSRRLIEFGDTSRGGEMMLEAGLHEVGHTLEDFNPRMLKRSNAYVAARTEGLETVRLDEVFPGYGYQPNEVAKPDELFHPYMGKDYDGKATEMLSMSAERLNSHQRMVEFTAKDGESFRFLLGQLGDY